jgi:hypothetical protein
MGITMPEEMIFSRCKNYDTSLCPHKDQDLMTKMTGGSAGTYLTGQELKELDNLCTACSEFAPKLNHK